jgi:ribosomal protein L11 methyltransferase
MPYYYNVLKNSGIILFSGFFSEDIILIDEAAKKLGLHKIDESIQNNWTVLTFKKDE